MLLLYTGKSTADCVIRKSTVCYMVGKFTVCYIIGKFTLLRSSIKDFPKKTFAPFGFYLL